MAEVEFQMSQLVTLAIGSPEVGAVNFNMLQKVLMEILKLTDIDNASVKLSAEEAAKLEGTYDIKPLPTEERETEENTTGGQSRSSGRKSGHQCAVDPEKIEKLMELVNQMKFDLEDVTSKVNAMEANTETVPFQEMRTSLSQVNGLQEKMQQIEKLMGEMQDLDLSGADGQPLPQRLSHLEKLVDGHEDQLTKIDSILEDKLKYVLDHFTEMEKEMGVMNEKLNIQESSSKLVQDNRTSTLPSQDYGNSLNNILSRLSSIQHDFDGMTANMNKITEDQEQFQMSVDAVTEQIEVLKTVKADKTNIEDQMAAKADISQIHRKVSHDHFETKMHEMNTMMDDAFGRLDTHEDTWQGEVEELKLDIANKLDKMEFTPLKDYVNDKLKTIQDKMKSLATQRREGMAAGTKQKLIRDVQCISCDNESVMRRDNTIEDIMPQPPLPSQQSVKPYLTYKLDQVRKQQKKLPTGKNLIQFEEMMHESPQARNLKIFADVSKSPLNGEHLVNRFVGGSHTITNPNQRVTRTGNFFETWGPVITAISTEPAA